MPRCIDCQYEGKYSKLPIPYPATLVGFEEITKELNCTKEDLTTKGMRCQAPGGGPTTDPIVLIQAAVDQACDYFSKRTSRTKMSNSGEKTKGWKFWKS